MHWMVELLVSHEVKLKWEISVQYRYEAADLNQILPFDQDMCSALMIFAEEKFVDDEDKNFVIRESEEEYTRGIHDNDLLFFYKKKQRLNLMSLRWLKRIPIWIKTFRFRYLLTEILLSISFFFIKDVVANHEIKFWKKNWCKWVKYWLSINQNMVLFNI